MLRHLKIQIKNENNELMSFRANDEKLLEKYKIIRTNIEGLKNWIFYQPPAYDDGDIKIKIRAYADKVYITFGGLNVL